MQVEVKLEDLVKVLGSIRCNIAESDNLQWVRSRMWHAFPRLGIMVLRHVSCMMLIKITGPESSVTSNNTQGQMQGSEKGCQRVQM